MNGIPYLTIITIKLDENFKILDFQADKANIKFQILNEQNYESFLWSSDSNDNIQQKINNDLIENPLANLTKKHINEQNDEKMQVILDENQNLLDLLLNNIIPINQLSNSNSNDFKTVLEQNKFLFILFGSSSSFNDLIVNSWIKFWIKFHKKHKFVIVYFSFDKDVTNQPKNIDFTQVEWYTINNNNFQLKVIFIRKS